MEAFRHQRSPGSERFLGLFSQPDAAPPPAADAGAGDELHEHEILWTVADPADPIHSPMANPNNSTIPTVIKPVFAPLPNRKFGILAALPEDDNKHSPAAAAPFLQRKSSISSPSTSSSARLIPTIPKRNPREVSVSVPAGKVYHQSAPVNVPVGPPKTRRSSRELNFEAAGADKDADNDEMLPPHEIVARASAKDSPMTTFSVLEGVGRTLKGRDLRRVRNAVWRQTGFLD